MKKHMSLVLVLTLFATPFLSGEALAKKEKILAKKQKAAEDKSTENLRIEDPFGFTPPYIPVLLPPMVKKVWIPPHVSDADPEVMIGGHWIFIKVTEDKWFIEAEGQKTMNFPILVPTSEETNK